jgi:nickel/cobalt exporter
MKRALVALVFLTALDGTTSAAAHPLGNFTVNRFSRIEPSGSRVYVLYVLDLAEIPTFQARPTVRAEGEAAYGARTTAAIGRRLELTVDGRRLPLRPLRHVLAFPPGQAGLRTTRLEAIFVSPPLVAGRPVRIAYRDANYPARIGWKEVVVAPAKSISDELLAYPKDLLRSPPDTTSASLRFVPGKGSGTPPALRDRETLERPAAVRAISDGGFAALISHDRLTVWFVLASLAVAFFWGAAHALSPGHGKSIVAAYLVGSRGTPRHALLLGLTVTVTHTIGVFALGLITLSLSEFIVPDDLYPWLNLVSALLIVGVGLSVLRWRVREWRRPAGRHSHHHGHAHDHEHAHDPALSLRRLLGVGISGGIIPCPTALVVLLAAISLHRVGYGLVLILAFSVGLATAMSGIGILAVTAKRAFRRVDFERGLVRLLPALSALVVLGLGLAMTVRALPKVT